MKVLITKQYVCDHIAIDRDDGSRTETRFPKKGPVPHDAIHYFVEDALGLRRGFWGMIASGIDPEQVQDIARNAGHASAKRASVPGEEIVELLQAERIVECFEADLWGGGSDPATLREMVRTGCESSHVPAPELGDESIAAISRRIRAFRDEWSPAPNGHGFGFRWAP